MGFILTLAYYLSQAPKRDITLWETSIKADDSVKRSQKKQEKKLRKIRRLRKKSKGRRRVALEVLEQRQREKIIAIRKDFDELVLETRQQRSSEYLEKCFAVVKNERASGQNDNLRIQLNQLRSSADNMIAELKSERDGLECFNSRLESKITELELIIKDLEKQIEHETIETKGAKTSRRKYVKGWNYTRKNLLEVLDGSDSDCSKIENVKGMLMGLSKHNRYTSIDAAIAALKRHEKEMDPRAEEIADRVREVKRLDRGRVFIEGYLKGHEDGKVKCW